MLQLRTSQSPERELQGVQPVLETCVQATARRLRTRLLNRATCDTPILPVSVRMTTAGDLLGQSEVADGVLWSAFSVERGGGNGFAVLEGRLLDGLVARLFGAPSAPGGSDWIPHALTDVEVRVGTRILDELYTALSATWPIQPAPGFRDRSTSVPRPVLPTSSAPMAGVTLQFGGDDAPLGRMLLALPAAALRGLQAATTNPSQRPSATKAAHYDRILPVAVDIVVELAHVPTTLQIIDGLQVGDELPLPISQKVTAVINGRPTFAGEAGTDGGQRSFRVIGRIESGGVGAET